MGGNKNRKTACPANPSKKRVILHHPDRIRLLARYLVEVLSDIEPKKMGKTVKNLCSLSLLVLCGTPEAGKETKVDSRPCPPVARITSKAWRWRAELIGRGRRNTVSQDRTRYFDEGGAARKAVIIFF